MIKLEQLDPDWQFAARHGQATLVGYNKPNKKNGSTAICPCCLQLIYKQQIPLTVSSKQLQFLGFGFPLFYAFLKNCMILLIILICTYNALSIRKAVDHNYYFCHGTDSNVEPHRRVLASQSKGPTCTTFMIQLARIEQTVPLQEQIIRIASFVLQLLYLIYMRDHITKLESYYDERNTSLSDYSIMIKRIPKQINIQSKLRQFFKKGFPSSHQIKQITLLPQYPEIDFLQKERIKAIDKLREPYNTGVFNEQDAKVQTSLLKIEQSIYQEAQESKKLANQDQLQCEKVILVFNTDQEKSLILSQFQNVSLSTKGQYFGVGAQQMTIKEAPEPKQILWQNINVSQQKKIVLYLISWGLSALVLILVTLFFYFVLQQKTLYLIDSLAKIEKDKNNQKYISNYNSAVALAYIMLFLIIFFNKLAMSTLFYKFTELERQETRSKFQFSFGLKYLLGLFFTTALMTLAVEAIRFDNYYSHPYGVIQQQTIMFFLNAFFTPLFWLFNPFALFKKLKRWIYNGRRGMTQSQANHVMENNHYDMGKRYAEIIQTMWFSFLYATLIPLGAFLSLAGVAFYFWVDKYTLLRKSSLGREVSGKIVLPNLKLLDVTLLLKAAGEMLFDIQIRHKSALTSSIVMLVISILYILIPVGKIIDWFNPQSFNLEQKTYEQVKQSFKDTYHTEHPVYKLIHVDKLKRKLSKKGLVLSSTQITLQNINSGKHQNTQTALLGKKIDSLKNLKQNNSINIDSQGSKDFERKSSINKIGSMRF